MLTRRSMGVAVVLIAAALARAGWADEHGKKGHAHKAPHGGIVQTVGRYHLELVVKDTEINVYLLDDKENTLPVDRREAKAALQVPKRDKQTLALAPAGEFLRAAADLKGVESLVAIVTIKLDDKPQNARFSWKRPAAGGHEGHHHEGHEEGHKD